jgi:phospholipid/cholesterol/gamma-HCH transport system ATP-binding protein
MAEDHGYEATHVDILNLWYSIGEKTIFDGLSCRFPQDKITVVLGGSGVGKSTLLRMIGCLRKPDWGDIWVGDQEITCMPEEQCVRFRQRIGMLFQGSALLDSMTVFDNVALPLREHTDRGRSEIADLVHRQFEAVDLKDVDHLLPGELSGGMKKRVALARAMVLEPEILLCDEPFSGLDPVAVRRVEDLLCEVNQRVGITMIVTSHHIGSTLRMAGQVVFLADGGAVCGPTREIARSIDRRILAFFEAEGLKPDVAVS